MSSGRTTTLALALTGVLAILGCGADEEPAAGRSAADRDTAAALVQHHAQTTRLVTLPQTLRLPADELDLADRVRGERLAEIQDLSRLLRSWDERVPDTGLAHEDEGHEVEVDASIAGVLDAASLDRLEQAKGTEFRRLWLDALLTHERGALELARSEVSRGRDAAALDLARADVARHTATIQELTRLQQGQPS